MRRITLAIIFALTALPATAEIVQPVIIPPPSCTGPNCPRALRSHMPQQPAHPGLCPPGTVYNPKKGTCKASAACSPPP